MGTYLLLPTWVEECHRRKAILPGSDGRVFSFLGAVGGPPPKTVRITLCPSDSGGIGRSGKGGGCGSDPAPGLLRLPVCECESLGSYQLQTDSAGVGPA